MDARSLAIGIFIFGTVARARASEPAAPGEVEVEVRAAPLAPPPKDATAAGTVVHADRLRAPGLSAADVLRTQPGVAVTDTGGYGGPSTASIRGATAAQTPVYLGGVRLNDDVGGTADLSLVPLWLLDRIEVYRSGAPIEADQLGIGGAIFFEPRFPRATEAAAGVTTGSFGEHGVFGHVGVGDERRALLVGGQYDTARNDYPYVNDAGTRFDPSDDHAAYRTNTDVHTTNLWALGRTELRGAASLKAFLNHAAREQGVPGLTLYPSQAARATLRRDLAAVTSQTACAADERCKLTATTSLLATDTAFDDPRRELALGTTHLDYRGARVEQAIGLRVDLVERVRLVPVVRAAVETLAIDSVQASALRAERSFAQGALGAHFSLARGVLLHGLASGECHGTSANGRLPWAIEEPSNGGSFCSEFEPSGRVSLELGERALKLLFNLGRYARVPTLGELYGTSGAVRGNPALVPETGVSADAGVRVYGDANGPKILDGSYLDVFGYVRSARDLIAYQRSALGYVTPYNVGRTRTLGLELLGGVRPLAFLLLELSATLLDPRNTSAERPTNDLLTYQARLVTAPRVELDFRKPLRGIERARLAGVYFFESERYADPAGLVVIPAQRSLDLEGELAVLHDHLATRLRVANVFNRARTDLVGYPLPGRAGYVTLEAKW